MCENKSHINQIVSIYKHDSRPMSAAGSLGLLARCPVPTAGGCVEASHGEEHPRADMTHLSCARWCLQSLLVWHFAPGDVSVVNDVWLPWVIRCDMNLYKRCICNKCYFQNIYVMWHPNCKTIVLIVYLWIVWNVKLWNTACHLNVWSLYKINLTMNHTQPHILRRKSVVVPSLHVPDHIVVDGDHRTAVRTDIFSRSSPIYETADRCLSYIHPRTNWCITTYKSIHVHKIAFLYIESCKLCACDRSCLYIYRHTVLNKFKHEWGRDPPGMVSTRYSYGWPRCSSSIELALNWRAFSAKKAESRLNWNPLELGLGRWNALSGLCVFAKRVHVLIYWTCCFKRNKIHQQICSDNFNVIMSTSLLHTNANRTRVARLI